MSRTVQLNDRQRSDLRLYIPQGGIYNQAVEVAQDPPVNLSPPRSGFGRNQSFRGRVGLWGLDVHQTRHTSNKHLFKLFCRAGRGV